MISVLHAIISLERFFFVGVIVAMQNTVEIKRTLQVSNENTFALRLRACKQALMLNLQFSTLIVITIDRIIDIFNM